MEMLIHLNHIWTDVLWELLDGQFGCIRVSTAPDLEMLPDPHETEFQNNVDA